jgi:hypothetical protein
MTKRQCGRRHDVGWWGGLTLPSQDVEHDIGGMDAVTERFDADLRWALCEDGLVVAGATHMIWHAILSTNARPPTVGSLLLVAMPTPNTNPHATGRILSVTPRPGGHMPTFYLTISERQRRRRQERFSALDGARLLFDDCRCREVACLDVEHFARRRFARNHWPEGS